MTPSKLFGAALMLAAACATPAFAEPLMSNNCRVDVRCTELPDGVYATVQVDAIWGALIDGDLVLRVNGNDVKVEPILTNTQQSFVMRIAPRGVTVTTCARLTGVNWIDEEATLPADTTDCAFWSSESPVGPNIPGRVEGPALRAPKPVAAPRIAR
jgi:hypothetical protein